MPLCKLMGKPIEGKIAANNCPFVPFPGVCLPRLAELNKTHLSCNSHNIPRAPFGAQRGRRRRSAEEGRTGSRRGWRGEDAPAYAQHPPTGHRDADVGRGASSQSQLGPGGPWPATGSDRAAGKWGCTGAELWLCSPPQHPKTGETSGAVAPLPTHPLPSTNPRTVWPVLPHALSGLSRNRPSVPVGCPGKPL